MANNLVFGLAALISLVPASILPYRRGPGHRDLLFWAVLAAAIAGPLAVTLVQVTGPWDSGLSMALWTSIATSLAIFALLCAVTRDAWRLTPLLLPYLVLLAVLAVIWAQAPASAATSEGVGGWLAAHIVISVVTYALCTLAAVAAAAVFLKERAMKRKQPMAISAMLPSVADADRLQVRLLVAAEIVLGGGVVTGMALQYLTDGEIFVFDHKTLLVLLAFVVIGFLLFLHIRSGLRGQRAARFVLLAYLLMTLAYPGVKFVTDVLIG